MNIKIKSNLIKQVIFVSVVFALIPAAYFFIQSVSFKKIFLENGLLERTKSIYYLSEKSAARALTNKDDLALIEIVEGIMKVDDVYSVYILDDEGKVISHNKTSQWGAVFNDKISKNAISAKGLLVQETSDPLGYMFSGPVGTDGTLCIRMSRAKTDNVLGMMNKRSIYASSIIFISSIILFALFTYFTITIKVKRIKKALRLLSSEHSGRIHVDKRKNELDELSLLINDTLDKTEARCSVLSLKTEESENNLKLLTGILSEKIFSVVIVLNSDRRIICVNDSARKFLEITEKNLVGMHLLDAVKDPAIIESVKDAAAEPGKTFEKIVGVKTLKVLAVKNGIGKLAGVVIRIL